MADTTALHSELEQLRNLATQVATNASAWEAEQGDVDTATASVTSINDELARLQVQIQPSP